MTIKTKLSAKLDTETFLSTSHFKIGKEPEWLQNKEFYKSTFQNDYAPKFKAKTKLSKKPPPATILQKDDSVYEQCSVSREQFVKKEVKRSPACKSLNQTNFKMDKDRRIETFLTTQGSSYKVKSNHLALKENRNNPMQSHIPQGDTEKETWPESDYTNNFYEKRIDENSLKRFRNIPLSTTIQGDIRSHRGNDLYNTTTNDMYPPLQCQIKSEIPHTVKYPKTSIPCGDVSSFVSTQKSSFDGKSSLKTNTLFSKEEALNKLQKTSFVSGDHRLTCFETTMDQCYPYPQSSAREHVVLLEKRKKFYNNITIPTTKMISSATSDYVAPPSTYRNRIIDGSTYHTASDVCLGNDKQTYYTTSMQDNFPQKMSTYNKTTSTIYTSNIPLQYYDNIYADTSYNLNFSPRKSAAKKLLLNNGALQNLRNAHICEQQKGLREFKTTHNELFTYKGKGLLAPIDTGRLQRSSVPLGTMMVLS